MSLEIKNNMIADGDKYPLIFWKRFGLSGESNGIIYVVSSLGNNSPWDESGNLRPKWKDGFTRDMKKCKGKYVLIEAFTALIFRKQATRGRETGLKNTIWWKGDVEFSRDYFFNSQTASDIQEELITFVISTCIKLKIKFLFSLLWEAHTLHKYKKAMAWFLDIKDFIEKKFKRHNVPVGIHSNHREQYERADFAVLEGRGFRYVTDMPDIPVVKILDNPGKWPSGKPENYKLPYNSDVLEWYEKEQVIYELVNYGCAARLAERWFDLDVLDGDTQSKVNLNNYNDIKMKRKMHTFYKALVPRLKGADRRTVDFTFCADLWKKPKKETPEPETDPKPEEKDKPTVPIAPVEEIQKEVKKMNLFGEITSSFGEWIRDNWKWAIGFHAMVVAALAVFVHPLAAAAYLIGLGIGVLSMAGKS